MSNKHTSVWHYGDKTPEPIHRYSVLYFITFVLSKVQFILMFCYHLNIYISSQKLNILNHLFNKVLSKLP